MAVDATGAGSRRVDDGAETVCRPRGHRRRPRALPAVPGQREGGHYIQIDQPDLVIGAIHDVVKTVRCTPLRPGCGKR